MSSVEADVVELADTRDSKSLDGNIVRVRPPPSALYVILFKTHVIFSHGFFLFFIVFTILFSHLRWSTTITFSKYLLKVFIVSKSVAFGYF